MRILGCFALTLFCLGSSLAQSAFTRTEVGLKGAFLGNSYSSERALGGFGVRYVFNITSVIAADADFTFYPQFTDPIGNHGGRQFMFFAGVKGGVRRNRFGYFLKARPGLRHYTETFVAGFEPNLTTPKTHFALELGGVLEYYPVPRWVIRFDIATIMTRMGDHWDVRFPEVPGAGVLASPHIAHSGSYTVGINYRFGPLRASGAVPERRPGRIEAGVQYSLLSIPLFDDTFMFDQSGVGPWVSYFVSNRVALDASASFFPQDSRTAGFQEGGTIRQGFIGAKLGVAARPKYGMFFKLRPGFMRFSRTITEFIEPPQTRRTHPATQFAFDAGAVFELYLPRRTVLRFDMSDTTVRYRETRLVTLEGTTTAPARTGSAIQLSVGFGLRF